MTRDEIREWLVELLLDKVREDRYPSCTHLDLIERWIPRRMIPEYLEVLKEKVEQDCYPSIPMLRRIRHVAQRLPHHHDHDHDHDREREEQESTG
jgi:hypothetical protein